jgi:hypothetical protein
VILGVAATRSRTGFVAGTRWWPPLCAAVDRVAGGLLAVALTVPGPW